MRQTGRLHHFDINLHAVGMRLQLYRPFLHKFCAGLFLSTLGMRLGTN
jgi:hypothetical protein